MTAQLKTLIDRFCAFNSLTGLIKCPKCGAGMVMRKNKKSGLKVSALYIAQTKRKYGQDMGVNYNKLADPDVRVPHCPKVKEELIVDALKHFNVLPETAELKLEDGGEKSGE